MTLYWKTTAEQYISVRIPWVYSRLPETSGTLEEKLMCVSEPSCTNGWPGAVYLFAVQSVVVRQRPDGRRTQLDNLLAGDNCAVTDEINDRPAFAASL